MKKRILILSTSLRNGSNSKALADEFKNGAMESGHYVEMISLEDKSINFCRGCLTCQKTRKCIINDDANSIVEKMLTFDSIVFATPIYFYEMSGQMKTLLDRTNPLYPSEYKFKDIYLIASAAEDENSVIDGAINGLKGWIACFEKANLKGIVRGIGLQDSYDFKARKTIIDEAFEMGKNA